MKYPKHIIQSYIPVSYEEVKPLVEKTALQLSKAGISASVDVSSNTMMEGLTIQFKFANPIVGRDFDKSKIECKGFFLSINNGMGRNQAEDEHGNWFLDENNHVAVCGEPYAQYQVFFRFCGNKRKYRCRNKLSIGNRNTLSFDYGTDMSDFDFGKNIQYLTTIH